MPTYYKTNLQPRESEAKPLPKSMQEGLGFRGFRIDQHHIIKKTVIL